MGADLDAYNVVKQHSEFSEPERQYAVTVARGEGFFGRGWATPSQRTIELSKKVGLTGFEGAGSHNWGAEQGKGDLGSFPHIDFRSDGSMYVGQYAKYSNDLASSLRFARILLKPNVREALRTGIYRGPIMRFQRPTAAQQAQYDFKRQFSGQNIGPLKAAVFSQSDNGYYELHPEKYLAAVTSNYAKATAATGWEPILLGQGTGSVIDADPLVPCPDGPPESGPPGWLLDYMSSEDMR